MRRCSGMRQVNSLGRGEPVGFAPGSESVGLWDCHQTASSGWRDILTQHRSPGKCSGMTGQYGCPSLALWPLPASTDSLRGCDVWRPLGSRPRRLRGLSIRNCFVIMSNRLPCGHRVSGIPGEGLPPPLTACLAQLETAPSSLCLSFCCHLKALELISSVAKS